MPLSVSATEQRDKKYCGNCNLIQIDTGMIFFGEFKVVTELRCLNGMKMFLNSSDSQSKKTTWYNLRVPAICNRRLCLWL